MSFSPTRDATPDGDHHDVLIVRSDDGRWRFHLPAQTITRVGHGAGGQMIVHVGLSPQQLAQFAGEYPREELAPDHGQRTPERRSTEQSEEYDDTILRIPLAQEHLFADKRPVVRGTVRVRTHVETEQQQLTVPILHEEALVEHIPAEDFTSAASANPDDILIPLYEERLVVEKRVVVKEYVRIRKRQISTEHEVAGAVRHEVATITEEPAANAHADDAPLISRHRRR
jgi:uncharacterized protein (TIGR02271 family)